MSVSPIVENEAAQYLEDLLCTLYNEAPGEQSPATFMQAIRDTLPDMAAGLNGIETIFGRMAIAEEEIASGVREVWPDEKMAARIWGQAFRACNTPVPLNNRLFRAHCKEIVQRARQNKLRYKKDRDPATLAELLHAMMQTSFATPLNQMGTRLYWILFKAALPDGYEKVLREMRDQGIRDAEWIPREDYGGQTVQLLDTLRQKFRQEREIGEVRLPSNMAVLKGLLDGPS